MAEVVKGILPSRALKRDVPYHVVLPTSYSISRKRYPVLYLLHGLFGSCDNWIELTELRRHADKHELIVVTPEGADSWYVDSASEKREKFENYVFRDLIPRIDDVFRTRAQCESRGIAGNSMGGYGALKFALKRPDKFAFAASTSGAFHAPLLSDASADERWAELLPSINRVFGAAGSRTRRYNDIFQIASRARTKGSLPVIFIDCGIDDSFLDVNREFSEKLTEYGIVHQYNECPGGHDWHYWDLRIREILKRAVDALS